MAVDFAIALVALVLGGVFTLLFLLQRHLYRQRRRREKDPGFYPSTRDFGNALHTLQIMAVPRIAYVMEVKQAEPKEQKGEGDEKDKHGA